RLEGRSIMPRGGAPLPALARLGALLLTAVGSLTPVSLAATPGEATNLKVTGYNAATGNLSFTYTPACSAVNHHIEFARLQDVRTLTYSGQVCGIGTSGSYASFNPGPGSYFFLVIGDDGVGTEGTYGTNLMSGTPSERVPDLADPVCSFSQDLSHRCDGPF